MDNACPQQVAAGGACSLNTIMSSFACGIAVGLIGAALGCYAKYEVFFPRRYVKYRWCHIEGWPEEYVETLMAASHALLGSLRSRYLEEAWHFTALILDTS